MTHEDENFALKFELNAIADLTIHNKAERWVPGFIWDINEREHRSRYDLALAYVAGKKVLDIAGGSGFGSYCLAEKGKASEVVACDLDGDAIRYGSIRYGHPAVQRHIANAEEFKRVDYFDVVVSFETIEHLERYQKFLENVNASLKAGGILIISTPIVEKTHTNCFNPFHKIEWSLEDFRSLVQQFFTIDETYLQSIRWKQPSNSIPRKIVNRVSRFISSSGGFQPPSVNPLPEKISAHHITRTIDDGYQIHICTKK